MSKYDKIFSNKHWAKNVHTVGELIEELKRLPSDLRLDQGSDGNGADIVIFNRELDDVSVCFKDGFDWDELEEGD